MTTTTATAMKTATATLLATVARHERRAVLADPAWWVGLAVFLLLAVYALVSGSAWVDAREAEAGLARTQSAERNAGFRADLAIYESGRGGTLTKPSWYPGWIKAPTTPDARVTLPALPLAALASNAGELQPLVANMRAASSRYALFDDFGASTQNPASLAVGRFDIAFLLTAVLPLLLLAFSYNLLSAEREGGTLALLLTQPVTLGTVVLGKLLVRGALILLPVLGVVIGGVIALRGLPAGAATWLDLGLLAVLVVGYGAFWLTLAALVNAAGRSSSTNALLLGGLWLALVMVLPSLLNVAATAVHPPPDRAELTNSLRATLVASRSRGDDLVSDFNLQHPERPITDGGAAHDAFDSARATLRTWLVRERADGLMAPVAAAFEQRLDDQQRLAERFRFVSPALAFQAALSRLAGTDPARTRAFRAAAREHLDRFRALMVPKIVAGQSLKAADFDRLPAFAMPPLGHRGAVAIDWLGIAIPALALAALAARAIRRYRLGA